MKYSYIKLVNYIGIFNGMHLNSIEIDLTKCKNRMLTIIGDNGSGKSTLFNAMSVLPDDNKSFIPGLAAYKEIRLQHGNLKYTITFNHPIKQNGDRDTTKAYIFRSVIGDLKEVQLNPNGNVTSFKDVLYDELGLDPNFIALSQLSTEDKGLASKKPAERKRFVNAIMSSLEVYNDIYKKLIKQSTSMKAMVQSLSSRLGAIGSPEQLKTNLNSINLQIDQINKSKYDIDKLIIKFSLDKEHIDPDGSIQQRINSIDQTIKDARKKLDSLNKKMHMPYLNIPADLKVRQEEYKLQIENIAKLEGDINELKSIISSLTERITSLVHQADQRKENIKVLSDGESFEDLCDKIATSKARIDEIKSSIPNDLEIELGSVTKAEYITALETLKEIKNAVQSFKASCSSRESMLEVLSDAQKCDRLTLKNADEYHAKVKKYLERSPILNEFIIRCDTDIEKLKQLSARPSDCLDDTCAFIADLIRIRDSNIPGQRSQASAELQELELCYEDAQLQIKMIEEYNRNANYLNNLIRLVTINGAILVRLPHGSIYKDKLSFIQALINNQDFYYIDSIYRYIHLANLYDEYINEKNLYDKLMEKKDQFESKNEVISQLNSEIEKIEEEVNQYRDKIEETHEKVNRCLSTLQKWKDEATRLKENIDIMLLALEPWNILIQAQEDQKNMISQRDILSQYDAKIEYYRKQVEFYDKQLQPLYNERDKINHSLRSIADYQKELDDLQNKFDLIEKLRYYSSPTSGIQLVFMEFYMGKIIGLANELLSLLFNGKYVIQPFIINDSEFRIPCMGDGYINDDISSMSSAQVSMISMILGFSLLYNSSTKYNVLKLDEIDGPLDETNRILFTDLLSKIMDIMNTEQCVIISHNSEINLNQSDVIILKSENLSIDNICGNVIWKY